MATISKLVVSLSADSAKLEKALSRTRKSVASWGKAVAKTALKVTALFGGVKAILGGALLLAINKNAAAIDNMAKSASKLGFPIEDFQKFRFIAEKSNVSVETFTTSIQRMVRRVAEAANGTGEAVGALEELGLSASQLAVLSPDQQFIKISEAMKGVALQGDKVRLAMKLFDTEGVELVNVMSSNIKNLGNEFEGLGVTITQRQADMVAAFQDSKTALFALFSGFSQQVTAEVSPVFTAIVKGITDAIQKMGGMRSAAQSFAVVIAESMSGALSAINTVSSSILDVKGFLLDVKLLTTVVAEKIASMDFSFKDGNLTGKNDGINPSFSALPAIEAEIKKNQEQQKRLSEGFGELINVVDVASQNIGKEFNDAHVQARISNQKKLAEQALKTANSLKSVEDTAKTTAKVQQAANVSDQFKQYFDMAKRDLNSGSIFADSKIQVLNNLIEASKNNAALPETTRAMQEMVDSLNNVIVSPASQNNTQINQSQSLGSLTLNMITNVGEVTGQILGTPQFLQSVKTLVERQVNDVARTAVN